MREILFRGKRIDDDKWTYGYLFKCWGRCYLLWGMYGDNPIKEEVYPRTVGEYTGLTDKNGTKIFEGDIMVFLKGATRPFKIAWDGIGWKMDRADNTRVRYATECDGIEYICSSEVIGNIYDNPELMEAVK